MKSMRRTRRALMLAIEFTSDLTRLPMEAQYLTKNKVDGKDDILVCF
jgi:hypothetical protein